MTNPIKGDAKTIQYLNQVMKNELTAINQYFLHAKMMKHMGLTKIAAKEYEESIDEMKHADQLAERILMIGGIPNVQDMGKIMIGETIKEMFEADQKIEVSAIALLREAIEYIESIRDFTSADLLHDILASEEGHYDWLRQQLDLIETMGEANYLQSAA